VLLTSYITFLRCLDVKPLSLTHNAKHIIIKSWLTRFMLACFMWYFKFINFLFYSLALIFNYFWTTKYSTHSPFSNITNKAKTAEVVCRLTTVLKRDWLHNFHSINLNMKSIMTLNRLICLWCTNFSTKRDVFSSSKYWKQIETITCRY